MDQRAVIHLEVERETRKYTFEMPVGAPLGEVYDVCFSMLNEVLKISKDAVERANPENAPVEVEKEEEEEDGA